MAVKIRREVQALMFDPSLRRVLTLKFAEHEKLRLPKGGVEDGESEIQALRREILEETGLNRYRVRGKIHNYSWMNHKHNVVHVVSVYLINCSAFDGEVTLGCHDSGGVITDAMWLKLEDALPRLHLQGEKEVLRKLSAGAVKSSSLNIGNIPITWKQGIEDKPRPKRQNPHLCTSSYSGS